MLADVPWFIAIVFATFMAGTSPDVASAMGAGNKNKIVEFLELESVVNTPIIVLLPFIVLDLQTSLMGTTTDTLLTQLVPFLQQIVVGIGAGALVGLIVLKILSKYYSEKLSPIAVIASALLTYVLAENLEGNGVLAVTTIAVIFGNVYLKHRERLSNFGEVFALFLQMILFILLGFLIRVPFTKEFFILSGVLFLVLLVARFLALQISFWKSYSMKEKIFMTLNSPKGIATAVVIFILSALSIPGMKLILDLGLMFILYSMILSTVVVKFSEYFIKTEIVPKKKRR